MTALQTHLFKSIDELLRQPLVVAYGLGVDSTALLVEFFKRGIRPDAILFSDTGSEKKSTYDYLPVINNWLRSVGFPEVTVVRYQPKNFKNWPPYATLGENCLTNGTLPGLAFGYRSCSIKWKIVPQNQWTERWLPAVDCWRSGGKVLKAIGYDASPKDLKRYAHAKDIEDPRYQYWYPLIDWGMDREACKQSIRSEGLPVPPKSACVFCPATQPQELQAHRKEYLRLIVLMEARAKPRLQGCMDQQELDADYQRRHAEWSRKMAAAKGDGLDKLRKAEPRPRAEGTGCAGLWRSATKQKPAMMTDYIRSEGLLTASEIEHIQQHVSKEIVQNQQDFAAGEDILNWHDFLEMFSEEDALEELGHDCAGCAITH